LHSDDNTLGSVSWDQVTAEDDDQGAIRDAVLAARLQRHWATVEHGVMELYPDGGSLLLAGLHQMVTACVVSRAPLLFVRDLAREANPGWFQGPDQVGYVCYTDLFAGTLPGVAECADYLAELGVTYLHLMPLYGPARVPMTVAMPLRRTTKSIRGWGRWTISRRSLISSTIAG